MTRLEKLRQRIARNPKHVRFADLDRLLRGYGFQVRQPGKGSSHYIYTRGWWRITVPRKRPFVREHYVRDALKLLEEIEAEGAEDG